MGNCCRKKKEPKEEQNYRTWNKEGEATTNKVHVAQAEPKQADGDQGAVMFRKGGGSQGQGQGQGQGQVMFVRTQGEVQTSTTQHVTISKSGDGQPGKPMQMFVATGNESEQTAKSRAAMADFQARIQGEIAARKR